MNINLDARFIDIVDLDIKCNLFTGFKDTLDNPKTLSVPIEQITRIDHKIVGDLTITRIHVNHMEYYTLEPIRDLYKKINEEMK